MLFGPLHRDGLSALQPGVIQGRFSPHFPTGWGDDITI